MTETHQELSALVVCKDERGIKWVELLLCRFNQVYLVTSDNDCRLLSQRDPEGTILPKRQLPIHFRVIFFHSSDEHLWKNNGITADAIFEFNTPGNPVGKAGILRILRCTAPHFDIKSQDIDDISDYLSRAKTSLPSVCFPTTSLEVIPALLTLCQTYLTTHSREKVNTVSWWLRALNLLEDDRISSTKVENLRAAFETEWHYTENGHTNKDAIRLLMESILVDETATLTGSHSQLSHQIVASAYFAFLEKLNFPPDELNVAQVMPEASIVFSLAKNPASTAVASALSAHLSLEHQFLNGISQQSELQATHKSILVMTERELVELPKLRLNGFSGAVLVIATEPFRIIKQKYRVLRFGHGSHDTFESPWHLSTLLTKAANLFPLEPENLSFLQNELKEYEKLYNCQIASCLNQLQQTSGSFTPDSIQQIADTIEQLRSTLPVACHAVVTIDEKLLPIQQHFQASIIKIRNSKVIDRQAIKHLQQTFEQLHDLVICTGAN